MDRDEARLAELGAANRQQPFLQIDVRVHEADRLANSQAGDAEQAEQCVIRPGRKPPAGGRSSALRSSCAMSSSGRGRVAPCVGETAADPPGHLSLRVTSRMMAGEATDVAQPLRPGRRRHRWTLANPLQCQRGRDVGRRGLP